MFFHCATRAQARMRADISRLEKERAELTDRVQSLQQVRC